MNNQSIQWLCRWLEETQGVTIATELLFEPWDVAACIAGLARRAEIGLPFDRDPTGFMADMENLAARYGTQD